MVDSLRKAVIIVALGLHFLMQESIHLDFEYLINQMNCVCQLDLTFSAM